MITHTVAFRLHHAADSAEAATFLATARELADIPGVIDFRQHRQTSPKNSFDFVFTMDFADQEAYTSYNEHPAHVAFVADVWQSQVAEFLEVDYVALGA